MKNISTKKYDYIDALRGFAILGVLLVHSSQWVKPASVTLSLIASQGARGVQLFFIASALTLFLSMDSRKQQQEEKPILSFFIRRFFRIAPAFYLAIIIYTAYYGMSERYWAPNGLEWWYVPLTVFFVHGWNPETINSVVPGGWSIAVEMTFYLFVPYLFSRIDDIKKTLFALVLFLILSKIVSKLVLYLLSPYYSENQKYIVNNYSSLWIFSQFPIFILGILLYHIIKKYPHSDKQTALLMLFSSFLFFGAFITTLKYFLCWIAFLLFSLSLYYLPQLLFVNRFTVFLGKLSFSLYLVHFMVLEFMKKIFSNGFPLDSNSGFIIAFSMVLAVSICISYITYKTVEVPGINLGKRIIKKL